MTEATSAQDAVAGGQARRQLDELARSSRFTEEELAALYAAGQQHWAQGHHDHAFKVFCFLAMVRPTNALYMRALALAHRKCGRPEKALLTFSYLHLLEQEEPRHELEMTDCLLRMGQPAPAAQMLDNLLERAQQSGAGMPAQVVARAKGTRALISARSQQAGGHAAG